MENNIWFRPSTIVELSWHAFDAHNHIWQEEAIFFSKLNKSKNNKNESTCNLHCSSPIHPFHSIACYATLQNQKQRYPMQETNDNNRCKNGKFKIEMGIHIKANFLNQSSTLELVPCKKNFRFVVVGTTSIPNLNHILDASVTIYIKSMPPY